MKSYRDIPKAVRDKLARQRQAVEVLTEKLARMREAIAGARERLTGGFQRDSEYNDLMSTLRQLVADEPVLESKLYGAEHVLESCEEFISSLPSDVSLEVVKPAPSNGLDAAQLRARIKHAEDEIDTLAKVPTPARDIQQKIESYVKQLARPKLSGIADGESLRVSWPDELAVLALLHPDKMVEVLRTEVARLNNEPMPPPQRRRRIAELEQEIDGLQRVLLVADPSATGLPPAIVLGVKVVRREREPERRTRVAEGAEPL
jgi:hypothetical protein